jgi:hypothetical protein
LLNSTDVREGTRAVADYLKRCFHRPPADPDNGEIVGGISIKPPGLPTVTVESSTHRLIGLHVDDWYSFAIGRRHHSPNRTCVNLGCEDRNFLFLNLTVAQMYEELQRAGRKVDADSGGTPIARAFMTAFPRYPVLRLRIRPGEAYIAPTENIAHDASSIEMSAMDVSLQIRGRFALSAAGSD